MRGRRKPYNGTLEYLWEDAPVHDKYSADLVLAIQYVAYPAELDTRDCPGMPAEVEIENVYVKTVTLYSESGEAVETDGTIWFARPIVEKFRSNHSDQRLAELCLDDANEKAEPYG